MSAQVRGPLLFHGGHLCCGPPFTRMVRVVVRWRRLLHIANDIWHRCEKELLSQLSTGWQTLAFGVEAQGNALPRSDHAIPRGWSQCHPIETTLKRLDLGAPRPTLDIAMRRREAHAPALHIRSARISQRQLTAHSAPIQGPADRQLQTIRAHDGSRHPISTSVIGMVVMGGVITHRRLTGDTLAQGIRTCSRLSPIGVLTGRSLRGQQVRSIDQ